jgi:cyanophycin synthetase
MTRSLQTGATAPGGWTRAALLFLVGRFAFERLLFRRFSRSRQRMRMARAAYYQSLWQAASAAIGALATVDVNGVIEISRGGRRLRTRDSETQLDDPAIMKRAGDKLATYRLLSQGGIPIARHLVVDLGGYDRALSFLRSTGGPLVVKPAADTGGGAGVTTNVLTAAQLRSAMAWSRTYGKKILVEEQIEGAVYRVLLMDGEIVDCLLRRPPAVVGDGPSTIRRLMREENRRRVNEGAARAQGLVFADRDLACTLARRGLGLGSRPEAGAVVQLKQGVNENALCENSPASGVLCREIVATARKAAALVGVRFAGVDVICRDPSRPLEQSGGVILEVNTQPGLYYHDVEGRAASIAARVLEICFGTPSNNSTLSRCARETARGLAG